MSDYEGYMSQECSIPTILWINIIFLDIMVSTFAVFWARNYHNIISNNIISSLSEDDSDSVEDSPTNNIKDSDSTEKVSSSNFSDIIADVRTGYTDNVSLESIAGTLISATKDIADTLDKAQTVPQEKKNELATLLKGVPDFITKILDMDDKELESILKGRTVSKSGDITNSEVSTPQDHRKESEYLMELLEKLH